MNKARRLLHSVSSIFSYPSIAYKLSKINSNIFFILPHIQTGGGERVHADIMRAVSHLKPTCLIAFHSENEDMREEFEKHAYVVDLKRWAWKKAFSKFMLKKIAHIINRQENAVVFGCGNNFFYDLLPLLSKDVKKVDLMHTYRGNVKNSFEYYSKPHAQLLNNRVVLGKKQKQQLVDFYQEHQLDNKLNDRIEVIHNCVSLPKNPAIKRFSLPVQILFVARNSPEKRPQIFLAITKECKRLNLPIHFTMIGDFEIYHNIVEDNVTITGRITDPKIINSYYEKSHLILVTSIFEGFPMVLLEGMSYGVIPISTDVGIISDFVNEKNHTGFLVPNHAEENQIVQDFVDRIQLLLHDLDELDIQSQNVKKVIAEEFKSDVFQQKYQQLLTP